MLDTNDLKQIEEHFDGVYRKVEDCDEIVDKSSEKFMALQLSFAKLETRHNIEVGILVAIATPLIPYCIKGLFGL